MRNSPEIRNLSFKKLYNKLSQGKINSENREEAFKKWLAEGMVLYLGPDIKAFNSQIPPALQKSIDMTHLGEFIVKAHREGKEEQANLCLDQAYAYVGLAGMSRSLRERNNFLQNAHNWDDLAHTIFPNLTHQAQVFPPDTTNRI